MSKVHKEEAMWQGRVAEEVEKIRSQTQSRRQEDISKAWRSNR
jgi:hypothetical protein